MCVSAKNTEEVVVCCLLVKKSRQSGITSHFFVPQGTRDLDASSIDKPLFRPPGNTRILPWFSSIRGAPV